MSESKLVLSSGQWHLCYQARGRIDGRRFVAWLNEHDDGFVCEVGCEEQVLDIPASKKASAAAAIYDDQFTFAVDEMHPSGRLIEHLAGANNALVAGAAYRAVLDQLTNKRLIVLRSRSRILKRSE